MDTILTLVIIAIVAIWVMGRRYAGEDHARYDEPQDELLIKPEDISPQHDDTVARLASFHEQSMTKTAAARRRTSVNIVTNCERAGRVALSSSFASTLCTQKALLFQYLRLYFIFRNTH